jgi:hypothetical protein
MTDAKARAIGVIVEQAWALHDWELSEWNSGNRAYANGQDRGLDALEAIAELLGPRPDPAHFYDYRV